MQKTIVQITCDNCQAHIVQGQEHTVTVELDGVQPWNTDWCPTCHEALVAKLTEGDNPLVCSCGFRAKSSSGLAIHQKRKGHS